MPTRAMKTTTQMTATTKTRMTMMKTTKRAGAVWKASTEAFVGPECLLVKLPCTLVF